MKPFVAAGFLLLLGGALAEHASAQPMIAGPPLPIQSGYASNLAVFPAIVSPTPP
jgi:hypothetical protein